MREAVILAGGRTEQSIPKINAVRRNYFASTLIGDFCHRLMDSTYYKVDPFHFYNVVMDNPHLSWRVTAGLDGLRRLTQDVNKRENAMEYLNMLKDEVPEQARMDKRSAERFVRRVDEILKFAEENVPGTKISEQEHRLRMAQGEALAKVNHDNQLKENPKPEESDDGPPEAA